MVKLYPILEPRDVFESPEAVRLLIDARVPYLQLRGGTVRAMIDATRHFWKVRSAAGTPATVLIVNDRADVARAMGAGVHVGQDDLPVADARVLLGPDAVVGLSTHDAIELENALGACDAAQPDYLAIGPIFATGSKSDARPTIGVERLAQFCGRSLSLRPTMPIVAIGGIKPERVQACLGAGAHLVAMIASLRDPATGRLDVVRVSECIAACSVAA